MTHEWTDDGHTARLTITDGIVVTHVQCPHADDTVAALPDEQLPVCRSGHLEDGTPQRMFCLLTVTAQVYQDDELWDGAEPAFEITAVPFPVLWRTERGTNGAEVYITPARPVAAAEPKAAA